MQVSTVRAQKDRVVADLIQNYVLLAAHDAVHGGSGAGAAPSVHSAAAGTIDGPAGSLDSISLRNFSRAAVKVAALEFQRQLEKLQELQLSLHQRVRRFFCIKGIPLSRMVQEGADTQTRGLCNDGWPLDWLRRIHRARPN